MEKNISSSFKKKVDNRLRRIADFLLLNASYIENLGLLNGKMGIAIFFFHYAKYTNNKVFENYAGELIDEIYEDANSNINIDFENGLTGIGWGIEYLAVNGFIEADTDIVLADIDNAVYNSMAKSPHFLNDDKNLFCYGLYLLSRLNGQKIDDENLNTLIKKQHLFYLTTECENSLIYKRYLDFNILQLSISKINSILWFFLEMYKLRILQKKIIKLIKYLPEYLSYSVINKEDWINLFVYDELVQEIIKSVPDAGLQSKFRNLEKNNNLEIDNLLEDNSLLSGLSLISIQNILYGHSLKFDELYRDLPFKSLYILENEERWNKIMDDINKKNLGLTGLAGIALNLLQVITRVQY